MTLEEAIKALHAARMNMLLRPSDERRGWYEAECRKVLEAYGSVAPATDQINPLMDAAQAMSDTLAAIEPLLPTQKLVGASKYARSLHRQALANLEQGTTPSEQAVGYDEIVFIIEKSSFSDGCGNMWTDTKEAASALLEQFNITKKE